MSGCTLSLDLTLPEDFRVDDVLVFHRRDAQQLAERVEPQALHKGLLWQGLPACLSIHFLPGQAHVQLALDGEPSEDSAIALKQMVIRLLGLLQPVAEFARCYQQHSLLGPLLAQRPGLRVPQTATPFEALVWAISGQQISVHAAVSLRRKMILAVACRHSSGLYCYPTAAQLLALPPQTLGEAGFSRAKSASILLLSEQVVSGQLPLDSWLQTVPVVEISSQLLSLRGIGPWTVSYALLRAYSWLDGSLDGDVAVRRNLQRLLQRPDKISQEEARQWLLSFSPWRALVAAHLWALQTAEGY
ncbi:3-methyladenine DNA glycosylase 2 [Neisseriaceae bacterium TC5R-5]|nr:3-methyladenine DNA glycosylase 2 [Neisseriaceae bacterium TC5R-5]